MRFLKIISSLALAYGLLVLSTGISAHETGTPGSADGIIVTRNFTGLWDQVDQEAQGIALQVVEQADNSRRAVAYWYTYGADSKTAWFTAIGDLIDNRIEFALYDSTDVGFMQEARPGNDSVQSIGTMTMSFDNCTSGNVTFDTNHSEVGSGSFRIERLAEIMNTHCSGGISDDMYADMMYGAQRIELTPARDGMPGIGFTRYEDFPGHSEFEIDVDGLVDGDYHLFVGAQDRGDFVVHQGLGELKFASPSEDGKMLLNFDPRGMQIEIHDASGVVLSSFNNQLSVNDHHYGGMHGNDDDHNYDCQYGPGSGHGMGGMGGMGGMHYCVDEGDSVEVQASLQSTGVLPGARGYAEWDMNSHRVQFSVEIENVPAGLYTLNVDGSDVGTIEAFQMHFGVYGHISFRDPESYGMQHLDFEPRGELIKVLQGSNTILEIEFPTE
jgi:hypothetical protein